MHFKRLLPVAVGLSAALAVTACSAPEAATSADSPRVVAAFYPLQWASAQVLGDQGSLSTLTTPGMEPHDLELTAQQVASLVDADLAVYLAEFQPAVDDAITQSGTDAAVLDVGPLVDLHSLDEADHGAEADGTDEHDHGNFDPHFWLDPMRMVDVVDAVATKLADIDPGNADTYAANAAAAVADLKSIDQEYRDGLSTCERTEFITTHDAFGYLADSYGLTQIGIAGISPDDEPSPARIAEIHQEATQYGITTIFFETLTSDTVASAIAQDLGLTTAVLDPLEGVTDNSPGTDYPSIMRANLAALEAANGCS